MMRWDNENDNENTKRLKDRLKKDKTSYKATEYLRLSEYFFFFSEYLFLFFEKKQVIIFTWVISMKFC